MDKTDCSKRTGCSWFGVGCCKKKDKNDKCIERFKDGGCRASSYCGFKCQDSCVANNANGCAWNGVGCVFVYTPPTDEYGATYEGGYEDGGGIVDQTDGILAWAPTAAVKGNVASRGLDNLCSTNKHASCAIGYPQLALVCTKDRDLTSLPQYLSSKSSASVYGPNEKRIGSLGDIISKSAVLKSTLVKAGVSTTNSLFWSGCDISGKYVSTLSCKGWSSKAAADTANVGSTKTTASAQIKLSTTSTCNTSNQVVCLCPRKAA